MIKRIMLLEPLDEKGKELIEKIQTEQKTKYKGIYELYDELYVSNRCRSYSAERIYYVAYTLANAGLKLIVQDH